VPDRLLAPQFSFRYTRPVATQEWEIYIVNEVREWIFSLDPASRARVV
jgi:hypothetical protein